MNTIFTDKALNNILWHRRALWVLVMPGLGLYRKFSKKKDAIRIRKKAFLNVRGGAYLIFVHPNGYTPQGLIKR